MDHDITESDQGVISSIPPLFLLPARNSRAHGERFNCLANCTYRRVWWPHANVEGISSASRIMFAARKRVQRRLRKEGPYRTGLRVQGDGQGPGTAQRTLTRNRSWAGRKMRRHEDNCRADVKWMNGYALRPHHELSDAHRYPA